MDILGMARHYTSTMETASTWHGTAQPGLTRQGLGAVRHGKTQEDVLVVIDRVQGLIGGDVGARALLGVCRKKWWRAP